MIIPMLMTMMMMMILRRKQRPPTVLPPRGTMDPTTPALCAPSAIITVILPYYFTLPPSTSVLYLTIAATKTPAQPAKLADGRRS